MERGTKEDVGRNEKKWGDGAVSGCFQAQGWSSIRSRMCESAHFRAPLSPRRAATHERVYQRAAVRE